MKKPKYLILRIVDAIEKSDLIEDKNKIKAFEDLERMYRDPNYMGNDVATFEQQEGKERISAHHYFFASYLGEKFWWKMDEIIGII